MACVALDSTAAGGSRWIWPGHVALLVQFSSGCSFQRWGAASPASQHHPSLPTLQLAAAAEYEPGKLSGAAALDAAFDGPAAAARVEAAAAAAAGVAAAAAAAGGEAGQTPLERAQNFLDEVALYSGALEQQPCPAL